MRNGSNPALWRRLRLTVPAIAAAVLIFSLAGCGGGDTIGAAGTDPLKDVYVVGTDVVALQSWTLNKVKADVLVHVDASDGMRLFAAGSEKDLENTAVHLRRGNTSVLDQLAPFLGQGGFINLGYRAGFFERVVWVIPTSRPVSSQSIEVLKGFLRMRRGYPEEALGDLAVSGDHIVGTLAGVPITITRLEDIEIGEGERALLDIDLSYFVGYKAQNPSYRSGTASLLEFVNTLKTKKIHTRLVTITVSSRSNIIPMDIRFFGRVLKDAFTRPEYLREPVRAKWMGMIEAEDSLVALNYESAAALYERLAEEYSRDPGLWFALAVSRGLAGKGMESREALLEAYAIDGAYMNGFFQLARVLAVNGKVEAGEKVLETPDLTKVLPPAEMDYQRGIFYLNAGRPFDAITYLEKVSQLRPKDFALQTVLYNAHLQAENPQGMLRTLEKLRRMDEARVRRDMPWVYRELGKIYEKSTLYGNAMESYREYLTLVPSDTSAPALREKIGEWEKFYRKK